MRAELLSILLFAATGCTADSNAALDSCMANGRAYYRRMGQYPTFRDGRDAEYSAREHCERSAAAFDDVG